MFTMADLIVAMRHTVFPILLYFKPFKLTSPNLFLPYVIVVCEQVLCLTGPTSTLLFLPQLLQVPSEVTGVVLGAEPSLSVPARIFNISSLCRWPLLLTLPPAVRVWLRTHAKVNAMTTQEHLPLFLIHHWS